MSISITNTYWADGATANAAALNGCLADPTKLTLNSTTGGGILLGRSASGSGAVQDIPFSTFVTPNSSTTLASLTVSGALSAGSFSVTNLSVPGILTAGAVSSSGSSSFNNLTVTGTTIISGSLNVGTFLASSVQTDFLRPSPGTDYSTPLAHANSTRTLQLKFDSGTNRFYVYDAAVSGSGTLYYVTLTPA